jgi:hypothetical protein
MNRRELLKAVVAAAAAPGAIILSRLFGETRPKVFGGVDLANKSDVAIVTTCTFTHTDVVGPSNWSGEPPRCGDMIVFPTSAGDLRRHAEKMAEGWT